MLTLLKNQTLGIINLSIPLIVLASAYPPALTSIVGILICSCLMGIYVFFLNYRSTQATATALAYIPAGAFKEICERTLSSAGIDPAKLRIRYGYSQEGIALAIFNTLVIDPLIWNVADTEAQAVIDILKVHVPLSALQKTRIEKIRDCFTIGAQKFVLLHEVGHIMQQYTIKRLILIGCISTLATAAGILTFLSIGSYLGVICGMVVAGILDLFLSFASNPLFKAREEVNADFFAARVCSDEELEEAAEFFETYETIRTTHPDPGFLGKVPSLILTGHLEGKKRAAFIRNLSDKQQQL